MRPQRISMQHDRNAHLVPLAFNRDLAKTSTWILDLFCEQQTQATAYVVCSCWLIILLSLSDIHTQLPMIKFKVYISMQLHR